MPEKRLAKWRDFRYQLDSKDLPTALNETVTYWQHAPFKPYYLNPEELYTWPGPWSLIADNVYCDIAKALAMVYTIYYSEHGPKLDIELRIYKCKKSGYEYNIVWINNGEYILNLTDKVEKSADELKKYELRYRFSKDDLHLEQFK